MNKINFLVFVFMISLLTGKSLAAEIQSDTMYVIQVKTHTNVRVIESAKKSLLAKYPGKKTLIQFRSPNYTLSIGYFATEAEAGEFKKELEKEYPGCTILPIEKKQ